MLRQSNTSLAIRAAKAGLHEFTHEVQAFVDQSGVREGLLTIFCRHTSASLLVQENAAPSARTDLEEYFTRLAPINGAYAHNDEGPDDMPAHLRSALTQTHVSVPIRSGRLTLGTWQGIYLFEHRHGTPEREIVLHVVGE